MRCDAPTERGPCAVLPKSCKYGGRIFCPLASLRLFVVFCACWFTWGLLLVPQGIADDRLLLICMPDQDPLSYRPSDKQIEEFIATNRERFDMTVAELTADPRREFARRVLGQTQIFGELAEFEKRGNPKTRIRFVAWEDAFRYFDNYASDPMNPPVVVQLGNSWAAYFQSRGVMPYERQHTLDVRMIWYWKDLVNPEEIKDGEGFSKVCRRLRDKPPPGLKAPFAIPTICDWDLLHNLAVWLYSGGLNELVSSDKRFGILPWKEAVFAGPEGRRTTQYLINLSENGFVDMPEKSNVEVLEDFLEGKYGMVTMGPWVPWRAERKLGADWQNKIGVAMPPKIGAARAVTFKGGSLIVVLDPSHGKNSEGVANARRLVDFLCSPEIIGPHAEAIAALPGNPDALKQSKYFPLFKDALTMGRSYPAIPQWAPVVENLATRDSIYAYWKQLSALTDTARYSNIPKNEEAIRREMVWSALKSAENQINGSLSPGKQAFALPWLSVVCVLAVALIYLYARHRRLQHRTALEVRQARLEMAEYQSRLARMEQNRRPTRMAPRSD
jgi:hypothetical protein